MIEPYIVKIENMYARIPFILVLLFASFYYLYNFYKFNYTHYKSKILATFEPSKKEWIVYIAISSIFFGLVAIYFIYVAIDSILKGVKTDELFFLSWFSVSLFFAIISIYYFPFNRLRLQFTDEGFIYSSLFYSWDDVKEIEWRPIKSGDIFKLRISMYWKAWVRMTWFEWVNGHIFDINTKQAINKILEGKVKIKS